MSIVIGGGTGFIGRAVAKLGANKGYNLLSVSRTAGKNRITWQDLSQEGLPKDCLAVVSMSGEPILQPFKRWSPEMKNKIHESRVGKTKLLNEAICKAENKPKVFVSLSGVSYYKPDPVKEYTETSVVPPYDYLSDLTEEWEKAAQLPASVPTRSVVIRTGVVLGNGGGVIQNLKMPFYFGLGGPIGSGKQWFPWVHVVDMAGIIWHAIENESVSGVLNGTSPNPVASAEFTKAYASAMCRPHLFPLPAFVVGMVFGGEESVVMLEGQKVLPEWTQETGYKFVYPDIESACKELVS